MVDCVIFDIGNVLFPFDYERAARRLGMNSEFDREAVVAAKTELETGRIGRVDFLKRVRQFFEFGGSDEEFLAIWSDIFDTNEAMWEVARRLAERYPLYLLSNISCIHREYLHARYEIMKVFRDGVYSYEVGLLKPDEEIFRLASERFGVEPQRAVYVDDMPENVRSAAGVGFRTVCYDFRNHAAGEAEIWRLLGWDGEGLEDGVGSRR